MSVTVCVSLLAVGIFYEIRANTMHPSSMWTIVGYIVGIILGWITSTYSIKLNKSKV